MQYTQPKFKLSVLIQATAKEVREQLSRAIDETAEIVLYGLVYWFRIWDHEYNLFRTKYLMMWLDFLIKDVESNLLDSKPLVHLLTLIRTGYYEPDIEHFN
ncbi:hypothetical protein EDI_081100 [Entamoeba dispar SAW760]|uniref:Uncharacterized protein n=1 Tax=Entamoeba dispar (strain ATCC PRA-260 / SAW760) TaxID=370354 RepID=B0EGU9_ENTDS|nr:uncharacterized protein EDI_081100 [Entamoeba dispar SAW760]EDR26253.1 hypothetical protein EDI_081100 [Entamoeba dispar SAW760]|eukprot:EDR26253.1 hypothetical protein EDI_081100 [Entamoeba dispar SAW760]